MILLPRPTDFVDWKAWATELTRRLDRSDPIKQVAEALVTGDNLSATYDASKRTITLAAAATTDEMIDDRVATLLTAGANITLTYNDVANTLTIAAADSGLDVLDEGATISGALFDTLDFVGAGVTVTDAGGGVAEVSIPGGGSGGVVVLDEGVTIAGAVFDTIDFVGAGVTVTDAGGGVAEVSIPGGGGSSGNPNGRAYVTPTLTDFTWVNQGSATATQRSYGITMYQPALGSDSLAILKRAAPTPPYEIRMCARSARRLTNYVQWGVGWRESSSGKLQSPFILGNAAAIGTGANNWNSPTSYNSTAWGGYYFDGQIDWYRISDDNTNRKFAMSVDGDEWVNFWTVSRTNFITPDEVFFYIDANNGSAIAMSLAVLSWEEL